MRNEHDETLVSSSSQPNLPSMNSTVDYGRPPDSPSNFFKCLYDSDLFADANGSVMAGTPPFAALKTNGQDFPSAGSIKMEPGTPSAMPQQQGYNSFVGMESTPPPYSRMQQMPPSYQQTLNCPPPPPMLRQPPASPMFGSQAQPSPVSALPDSTSFVPPVKQNGFSERRMSDGGIFDESAKSPGAFFEHGPAAVSHHMRSQSVGDYTNNFVRFADPSKQDFRPGVSSPADSSASGVNGAQKAFVPCKVCGDKASGYHYGVTSCEGCKGFFRRSIQKQIEYRCLRDGKCMVFRLNRNRCQYCRFKKCLAVGMSRDSVRYGRVPKRSRERMQDDTRVSSMTGDSEADSELEKKQLALYDIILSVSQAHHSNCAYTDDKIKNLSQRPMNFPLERCSPADGDPMGASTELLEQHKIVMWETLANFTTPEIQRAVEFAKRIPGFTDLMQDDQLILIKAGFFEVWLVRVARMFNAQHCTVTLSDGRFVSREQLELIYNPELVASMFSFSVSFNNLHLNDGEIGLFTAVVMLSQDRPGLSDPKLVEQLQEKLIEALKLQLSRSHSSDLQVFPNLLMKLSELRSVGAKHNEVLGWYRMNWHRLKLPPLYAEIYDIAKAEDPPQAAASAPQTEPTPAATINGFHAPTPTIQAVGQ